MNAVWEAGGTLIAHNMKFDMKMIMQTARVAQEHISFNETSCMCTMKKLRKLSSSLRGRNCKNVDVFNFLKLPPVTGDAHSALGDSLMTGSIYFHGRRNNWW